MSRRVCKYHQIGMRKKMGRPKIKIKAMIRSSPNPNPSFSTAMITLKLPKPFITKYLASMSSDILIMYTLKEKHRCNAIVAQQELNTNRMCGPGSGFTRRYRLNKMIRDCVFIQKVLVCCIFVKLIS